jgi:hypothetical protein
MRYSVQFQNATYRNHDLDKLVILFKPETDAVIAVLFLTWKIIQ